MTFDEGGVASRSRMNPVRQYNKDKPNKFRVDFFVLANNSPGKYFIVHLDVGDDILRRLHQQSHREANVIEANRPEPLQADDDIGF